MRSFFWGIEIMFITCWKPQLPGLNIQDNTLKLWNWIFLGDTNGNIVNGRLKVLFWIPQQRYPCYSLFTGCMIFFQTVCPASYCLCHKHCPIFSVHVCDVLPTRCQIFGPFLCLFVCLIVCPECALHVSFPHAVFRLLCLPVFCLQGQTAEMKSPGTSVTLEATQEDAHSHKTKYCCNSRYQTANVFPPNETLTHPTHHATILTEREQ